MAAGNHVDVDDREIEVSDWLRFEEEELGTKPKRWLVKPATEERWLMKYATFSQPKDGPEYRKGDDWAERIACGVARVLGIPAAPVELAVERAHDQIRFGTVCLSVLRGEESLINGDELMGEVGIRVSRNRREFYTVEAVFNALEDIHPPPHVGAGLSAWDVLVGYLALDALIGNTDRHEENWSAIKPAEVDAGRQLSPTFDHASSLGFQLSDQDKKERLSSRDKNRTPEGYADRAKTQFANKQHPISVLRDAQELAGQPALAHWLGHVRQVDDLVAPIWEIPAHRMSAISKDFAERLLRHNWSRLAS